MRILCQFYVLFALVAAVVMNDTRCDWKNDEKITILVSQTSAPFDPFLGIKPGQGYIKSCFEEYPFL